MEAGGDQDLLDSASRSRMEGGFLFMASRVRITSSASMRWPRRTAIEDTEPAWCRKVGGIVLVRLAAALNLDRERAVGNADHARLAVQLEEDADLSVPRRARPPSAGGRSAPCRARSRSSLLAERHAVEEHRCRQDRDRPVFAMHGAEIGEHLGIHRIGGKLS